MSFRIDGDDDYAALNGATALGSSLNGTALCWVRCEDTVDGAQILSIYFGSLSANWLRVPTGIVAYLSGGAGNLGAYTLASNTYVCLAIVRSSGTTSYYIVTEAGTRVDHVLNHNHGDTTNNCSDLVVGEDQAGGAMSEHGSYRYLRYWSRALSATEISAEAAHTPTSGSPAASTTNLRGSWALPDGTTTTDWSSVNQAITLSGGATSTDEPSIPGAGGTILTDTLTLTDAAIRGVSRPRSRDDTATVSDATIRKLIRGHVSSDAFSVTDDPTRTIQMIFDDESIALSDDVTQWRRLVRVMGDSVLLTDAIAKSLLGSGTTYTRTLSDAVEFADGIIRYVHYVRRSDDALDLLDAFSKTIAGAGITYARILSDSVTMIDETGNLWRFRRTEATDAFALQDMAVSGAVRGRITTDVAVLNDAVTRWAHLVRQISDDVEFSDGVVRMLGLSRTITDEFGLTDDIVRTLFLDQLQTTDFRFMVGADPFIYGAGSGAFIYGAGSTLH